MDFFFRLRKSFMTLLETLIAFSLLSILLIFVFGLFKELSELTRHTEMAQKESFKMRYLETRLGFIFERVVNEKENARNFVFYTQPLNRSISNSPSLIMSFNNEVRKNPQFSGDVLVRFYLDNNKQFRLATWPLKVDDPHQYFHEEILMDEVASISYLFYSPPHQVNDSNTIVTDKEGTKKSPAKDTWQPEWSIDYKEMPSMVEISIEFTKESQKSVKEDADGLKKEKFFFVLPSSKNPIHVIAEDESV